MATPYDVIGNVVTSGDAPVKDVVVSDGTQQIKTDADGYYEIKTEKKTLTFSKSGFVNSTFDLGKYKLGAKVNADVTLNATSVDEKSKTNKKMYIYIGVGIVLLIGGYLIYKRMNK